MRESEVCVCVCRSLCRELYKESFQRCQHLYTKSVSLIQIQIYIHIAYFAYFAYFAYSNPSWKLREWLKWWDVNKGSLLSGFFLFNFFNFQTNKPIRPEMLRNYKKKIPIISHSRLFGSLERLSCLFTYHDCACAGTQLQRGLVGAGHPYIRDAGRLPALLRWKPTRHLWKDSRRWDMRGSKCLSDFSPFPLY